MKGRDQLPPAQWQDDERYMREALKQAQYAFDEGEIPVGAVLVANGRIIARSFNQTQTLHDPTAHAEMLAITTACHALGTKYLPTCSLYVTLEPCPMCAGALYWSQIGRVVFGAPDTKRGYHQWTPDLLHPKTELVQGVLEEQCSEIISRFFKNLR
jgi:tRNA(adenine34) deaminase